MGACRQPVQLTPQGVLSSGQPEAVGIAPDRLGRITQMLEQAVSDGEIPGGVALIARNGKVVYHHAFGMSDVQDNQPFSEDAIFRIASQTKAITSTAVMMLWEEGRFRLDDPISRYIPEFGNPSVLKRYTYSDTTYSTIAADKEITIRHLLTHTSGLGDTFTAEFGENPNGYRSNADYLPLFADDPLMFEPGDSFAYSNASSAYCPPSPTMRMPWSR